MRLDERREAFSGKKVQLRRSLQGIYRNAVSMVSMCGQVFNRV